MSLDEWVDQQVADAPHLFEPTWVLALPAPLVGTAIAETAKG
jgi:hypothetical protein